MPVIWQLKDRNIGARRDGRYVSFATDTHAKTEELLEAVFSMRSLPRLYSESHREKLVKRRECEGVAAMWSCYGSRQPARTGAVGYGS
jgi:hypothetical protein